MTAASGLGWHWQWWCWCWCGGCLFSAGATLQIILVSDWLFWYCQRLCSHSHSYTHRHSSLKCNQLHYKKKERHTDFALIQMGMRFATQFNTFSQYGFRKMPITIIILANGIQSRRMCSLCNQQMSEVLTMMTTMTSTRKDTSLKFITTIT